MIGRKERLKTTAILILLLSLCSAQKSVESIPLNDLKEFSIKDKNGGKAYFSATINEKQNQTDIIVQLNSLSMDSDPDLSVFLNIEEPPKSNVQPYCNSDQIGYDVCLISDSDINADMKILVEVVCSTPCKYSLNLIYKERIEYDAEKGGKIDVIFKEDEVREILLKIPQMDKVYSNMLILAEFKNMYSFNYEKQASFDFYGNKGTRSPETKSKAKHISIWINDNIRAIPLSKVNKDTCFNKCEFSLEIKGPKDAIVTFSAVLFDNEREIKLSEQFSNGVVEQGEVQYFTIDFEELMDYEMERVFTGTGRKKKFAANLLFNLIPYNGDPNLYIHYGERKPDLEKFDWQSKASFRQDLILITSDELNSRTYSKDKKIYIAIYGVELSAYQLRIDIYSNEFNQSVELQHGQPITGFVGKKQIQNYQLRVEGTTKRDLDIVLNSLTGNTDLFVKKWRYGDGGEQNITQEEIDTFYSNMNNKHNPFIGWSINKQGVDTVKVTYDPGECGPDFNKDDLDGKRMRDDLIYISNYCVFTIAVLGQEDSNRYILKSSSFEPSTVTPLRENTAEYVYLDQLDSRYYTYKPMSLDTDIEQIRIQLYFASGFATIAADRDYEKLKKNNPEKDSMKSSTNHYVQYNANDLKKGEKLSDFQYFVQIKALERTNAQVKIEIVRKGQKKTEYTEIISGFPTKLVLDPKSSGHIKFVYSYGSGQTVVAKSDAQIKLYVGEDKSRAPSGIYHKYNADTNVASSSNVKRIDIETSLSTEEGYLYGTIENVTDQQITVVVYVQSDLVNLDLNNSLEDILIPNVKRTYFFNIYPDIITEKMYAYVLASGTVLEQKLSGYFYFNSKSVAFFRDTDPIKYYEIKEDVLKKECPHLYEENKWQDCQFKIEVISPQEERLTVSIVSPERPSYIQYYGATISQLPLKNETRKFLYYMYGIKEFILTVQSFSYDFQLLGKMVTYSKFQSIGAQNGNNFPTLDDDSKKLSIHTESNVFQQVRLHPESYNGESCDQGCFLLISIVLPKASQIDDSKIIGNIMKLSISGDKIYDLYEGESVQGIVNKDEMIYYRVFVPTDKENNKLIVNLTPLDDGDPDLFLNNDSTKLPTRSEHDLSSQDAAGDFLLVNRQTFKKGISGYYIVGVYGNSKSTFTIQYSVSKYNIFKIEKDSVQQVSLYKNDIQYFVYHKREKGSFTVVTNMVQGSSGDSYLFIKEFRNIAGQTKDFLANLADPNNADKTSKNEARKEYLRWEDDCDDCTYIIGIKSFDKSLLFSVSLNIDGGVAQIQSNKIHLMYLKQSTMSKLRFFSQEDFNLYVTSYQGHCVEARVKAGFAPQETLYTKTCRDEKDVNASGFDSFSFFVKHPFKDQQVSTGLGQQNTFTIELISSFGDEKVLVQVVSGQESRLITAGIPVEQEVNPNSEVKFLYYSSHEQLQSVQVHLSAEPGQDYGIENTEIDMKIFEKKDRIVIGNIISQSKELIAKQFQTEKTQPYYLIVKYSGNKKFKFSVLMKESNTQNIPILSGSVIDVLPIHEYQNYEVHIKKDHILLIQNFNCISDQNIFLYRYPHDLLQQKDNAERVTRKATSNHEVQIVRNTNQNEGVLYIQKRANKQTKEKISKSIIMAEVFKRDEPIIYDHVQIGDSGLLMVGQDLIRIYVTFSDLECVQNDCWNVKGMQINSIEYSIHVSDTREDLQRSVNCLIEEPNDLEVNKSIAPLIINDSSPLQEKVRRMFIITKDDIPDHLEKVYLSVSAKVTISSATQDKKSFRFIYASNLVDNIRAKYIVESKTDSDNLVVIVTICGFSIAILLLILIQLYRRYRNVHKKLKYEMNDVRNVAHSDLENDTIPQSREYNSILPSGKGQSEMIEMK